LAFEQLKGSRAIFLVLLSGLALGAFIKVRSELPPFVDVYLTRPLPKLAPSPSNAAAVKDESTVDARGGCEKSVSSPMPCISYLIRPLVIDGSTPRLPRDWRELFGYHGLPLEVMHESLKATWGVDSNEVTQRLRDPRWSPKEGDRVTIVFRPA
jgi:hypothetical protein